MRALILGLALVASPALAQDFSYDPAILTACLAAAGDDRDSCIGKASGQCLEGEGASSTVGTVACLRAEADQWDGLLNTAYASVLAQSEQTDAEMKELGSAADPEVPALRDMQRSWIAYRDAACAYEVTRWGGGSGSGPAATGCVMELTARQALRLMGYADTQR